MMVRRVFDSRVRGVCGLVCVLAFCMLFSGLLYAQQDAEPGAQPTVTNDVSASTDADAGEVLAAIQKKNTRCLRCHTKDKTKTLEDGEVLSLQLSKQEYMDSAHGEVGCVSCHEAIGNRRHPSKKTNITIASQRDYSVGMNESCRNCHEKKYTQYKGSIHSAMVTQGSTKAPVCTDCHGVHGIKTMDAYQADTGLPCKKCHGNVYQAYSESVHGTARVNGNVIRDEHIQAPICSDCHQSHEVTAVAIGDTLRSQCLGCHENVPLLHSQWLPNAGSHLDIVSCAVCHAPFAKHRYDLHLYDNVAKVPVGQQKRYELFQQQLKEMEKAGGSVDPLEVWKLVEAKSQDKSISLRGRMEVVSGVWAHQIASKDFAVRTCDSCHQESKRQGLGVTVSVPGEDGRVQRYDTDRDNLGSIDALESISDFYALGGNPNKLLDILLLLALASGIAIPVGHFTLGKMIREKMERGER